MHHLPQELLLARVHQGVTLAGKPRRPLPFAVIPAKARNPASLDAPKEKGAHCGPDMNFSLAALAAFAAFPGDDAGEQLAVAGRCRRLPAEETPEGFDVGPDGAAGGGGGSITGVLMDYPLSPLTSLG